MMLLKKILFYGRTGWLMTAMLIVFLPALVAGGDYQQVTGPCSLSFPDDHDAHPGYRTEWWYYTGNLVDADNGRRFGFQLTFFRSRLRPPDPVRKGPRPQSDWRADHIYLAHAALTDIGGQRHLADEKMARAAMGLAGITRSDSRVVVELLDWRAEITPQNHRLSAAAQDFSLDLVLTPLKPPVFHGQNGYSRKGQEPGRASCYYSFTRLAASGRIVLDGRSIKISGLSWMDHEFSSQPLEPDLVGWDWFSVQLSDQTELMIFLLREKGGGLAPASSGTFIRPDGSIMALARDDIRIAVLDRWKSPRTGAVYPAQWRVSIGRLNLELVLTPNLANQEMQTPRSTRVTYWEGSVRIRGRRLDRPVSGSGYVELTGYAGVFDAPL